MKILRPAAPKEVNDIYLRLTNQGKYHGQGHCDRCTPVLCVCSYENGSPKIEDYEAAGQPLPGCSFSNIIDMEKVQAAIVKRMKTDEVR